jgi:hypothetical protein
LVPLVSPRYSLLPLVFILTQFYPILVPVAHKYAWTPSPSTFTCLTDRAHCEKIPTPLDRNHARAAAQEPRRRPGTAPPREAQEPRRRPGTAPPPRNRARHAKPIFLVPVSSARPELACTRACLLSFPAPTSLLCPCTRAFPAPISNAGAQLLCSAGARLRAQFSLFPSSDLSSLPLHACPLLASALELRPPLA